MCKKLRLFDNLKESGWKFCVNWPIGGWKKYLLHTLYYLSNVISHDTPLLNPIILCF